MLFRSTLWSLDILLEFFIRIISGIIIAAGGNCKRTTIPSKAGRTSEMNTPGSCNTTKTKVKNQKKVYIFRLEIEEVAGKISYYFFKNDTRKKLRFFEPGDTISTDAL